MQTFLPVYKFFSTQIPPEAVIHRPDFLEEIRRTKRRVNRELLVCLENPHIAPVVYTTLWERKEEHELSNEEMAAFWLWIYNVLFEWFENILTNTDQEPITRKELIEVLEENFKKIVGIREVRALTREQIIDKEIEAIDEETEENGETLTTEDVLFLSSQNEEESEESISLLDAHDKEGQVVCEMIYGDNYNPKMEPIVLDVCDAIHKLFVEMYYSTQKDSEAFIEAIYTDQLQDMSLQQHRLRWKLHDAYTNEKEYHLANKDQIHPNIFSDRKGAILEDHLRAQIALILELVPHTDLVYNVQNWEDCYTSIASYLTHVDENKKAEINYYIDEYIKDEIIPKVQLGTVDVTEQTHWKHKHYFQEAKEKIGVE